MKIQMKMLRQRRRAASPVVLSLLVFIGSVAGLLALLGQSYSLGPAGTAQVVANLNQTGPGSVKQGGTSNTTSVAQSSAGPLAFLGTPLGASIAIAVVFIALGILAGLFGAGILANIIAGVGGILALVNYFTGTINSILGPVPLAILGIVLGIITSACAYILIDTLGKGGV